MSNKVYDLTHWTVGPFQINCHGTDCLDFENGKWHTYAKTRTVGGFMHGIFGVHFTSGFESDVWILTHLPSGWALGEFRSATGAQLVADYILKHHRQAFEAIKVDTYNRKIENYNEAFRIWHEDVGLAAMIATFRAPRDEKKANEITTNLEKYEKT